VTEWTVWRQDDNGNPYRVAAVGDRVGALARVLELESGHPHKQLYWADGPTEPSCRTNRDLYVRLLDAGRRMTDAGRTLDEFLRAWWLVAKPLCRADRLDLDSVAALVEAAARVEPPPLSPAWRTARFPFVSDPATFGDWESIVLSQVADLADFADQGPLDQWASLGIDAPRPPGTVRATSDRWYNFTPSAYLECGTAGSLGGWDAGDGVRVPLPGPVTPLRAEPDPGPHAIGTLTWADLADLAICGQLYE
jgi:hypothetical protein